jgi:hypothetical protein
VYTWGIQGAQVPQQKGKKMYKELTVKELRTIAKQANVNAEIGRRGTGFAFVELTSENDANIFNQALNNYEFQLSRCPMLFTNGKVPAIIRFQITPKAGN